MLDKFLRNIPSPIEGSRVERKEPCRSCGSKTGILAGQVDYWDIKQADLIKCDQCGLAQMDPMLTQEETAKGCLAYYVEETLRVTTKEQKRNLVRNFRRGILFAYSLKKRNIVPKEILELGPGSGYFVAGIHFVFPDANVTVMDVNEEVLRLNQQTFGYSTIQGIPDNHISDLDNSFDLIIARDIIEHVIDIDKVTANINAYLKEGGYFHFITPNGHEDIWKHYLTFNHKKKRSELLINHVSYFDGQGLLDQLKKHNLEPVDYHVYKMKTTRRGRGRKIKEKLMASVSEQKGADIYVNEKVKELKEDDFDKNEVLDKWYINSKMKGLTRFMSWYHHSNMIKVHPKYNVGHEIYGLFQKRS